MSIAAAPDVSKVQRVGRGHSEAWHRISFFLAPAKYQFLSYVPGFGNLKPEA
jgi:hypothetical protein